MLCPNCRNPLLAWDEPPGPCRACLARAAAAEPGVSYVAVLRLANGTTTESNPFPDRATAWQVGFYSLLDADVLFYTVEERHTRKAVTA